MIDRLRVLLNNSSLNLYLSEDWGAARADHRARIRRELSISTGSDQTDLARLPQSDLYSISISHAGGLGGFATVERPALIGFDLEETARVSRETISRVSQPAEVAEAPSFAALWTAKEAAWKALAAMGSVRVVGDLTVSGWVPTDLTGDAQTFEVSTFRAQVTIGQGLVFTQDKWTLAVFLLNPST